MVELLALVERVRNTIQLGESHFREFKSALEGRPGKKVHRLSKHICQDIGEALVAFANADGGELLIGVEDDGTITGVPHWNEDVELMLNAYNTHVHAESHLHMLNHTKLFINGKTILFFAVAKGTAEIYQLPDGRCVRRQDKSTVPVNVKKIMFERQEILSREYDRQFVDAATLADLDLSLVQSMADQYLRGISLEKYLQQIGLGEYSVGGLRLRMAALLLFAKDIQRWHPRCQIRILKVIGTELKAGERYNVQSDEFVQGNIFELLVKSWEALRPFLAYKTEFGYDAKFEQKYIYPELACREALVNAIAHRDYTIQNGVDVFIFDDRMEIRSPGLLLSTISISDLKNLTGAHESRNSFISRILRENKFMRELGEGMRRIFKLMEEHELSTPEIISDNNSFFVTLFHKSVYSPQEQAWIRLFESYRLSSLQHKIIALGMNECEISPHDIYIAMSTRDRNVYDREVTGLRITGILTEIRSSIQAQQLAKHLGRPKQTIPRFKVQIPNQSKTSDDPLTIFIANIPVSATEEQMRETFRRCGGVTNIILARDTISKKPRGFGFVKFSSVDAVENALRSIHIINDTQLSTAKYNPPVSGKIN